MFKNNGKLQTWFGDYKKMKFCFMTGSVRCFGVFKNKLYIFYTRSDQPRSKKLESTKVEIDLQVNRLMFLNLFLNLFLHMFLHVSLLVPWWLNARARGCFSSCSCSLAMHLQSCSCCCFFLFLSLLALSMPKAWSRKWSMTTVFTNYTTHPCTWQCQ